MEENFKVPSLDNRIKFVSRKSSEKLSNDSVAEISTNSEPTTTDNAVPKLNKQKCPYVEPKWSQKPEYVYSFEVLKGGTIAETVKDLQNKAFWLIGKLPDNDIPMAHPTVSRYHAVFQYRPELKNDTGDVDEDDNSDDNEVEKEQYKSSIEKGWYLYDLNSTHGSFVNKTRIPPKTYVRVRVGYLIKFGCSTRNFILQGPEFDEEQESELSVTEIKELRRKKEEEYVANLKAEEQRKESEGISWGMVDDAEEETDLLVNPYATTNNEELFLQDPKKTLRGYFEREGYDLDYKVDEMSPGTFLCRIELPISDVNGRPLIAEVCHKGKKKECVLQCALEACRMLDRQGVLRQANHESRKRKVERHSDSDGDDDFYDRTGDVERKKLEREATGNQQNALSYDELLGQEQQVLLNLAEANAKIDNYKKLEKELKEQSSREDDLDDFMSNLTSEKIIDKTEIRKLRFEVQRLTNEHTNLKRLIKIARPVDLMPTLQTKPPGSVKKNLKLPLFGKRGTFKYSTAQPIHTNKSDGEKKVEENVEKTTQQEENQDDKKSLDEPSKSALTTINDSSDSMETEQPKQQIPEKREFKPECHAELADHGEQNTKSAAATTSNSSSGSVGGGGDGASSNSTTAKKKRSRIRIRSDKTRENVDIDEEMVDTEKYSTWVPPQGQSGDGSTNLNEKYGY